MTNIQERPLTRIEIWLSPEELEAIDRLACGLEALTEKRDPTHPDRECIWTSIAVLRGVIAASNKQPEPEPETEDIEIEPSTTPDTLDLDLDPIERTGTKLGFGE